VRHLNQQQVDGRCRWGREPLDKLNFLSFPYPLAQLILPAAKVTTMNRSQLAKTVCACAAFVLFFNGFSAAQTQPLAIGSHTGGVSVARFSPDGQLVVTGSFDRTLQIHSATDGKLLRTLPGHPGQVLSLAITPDGRRIISGGRDNSLQVWDLFIPTPLVQLPGHAAAVSAVAVSGDDAWVATGAVDNSLKLFSRTDGKLLRELAGHSAAIARIAVKADNTQLATGDGAGIVRLWNPPDGAPAGEIGAQVGAVAGLAYHPTESTLFTAGSDGTVKLWTLPVAASKSLAPAAEAVTATAISADGALIVSGAADGSVRIFTAATGEVAKALEGQAGPVSALALAPNAALVASGSKTGAVQIWNVADGARRRPLLGHAGEVRDVCISAQGDQIVSAGDDGTVRLWRIPGDAKALAGHTMPVGTAAVSPDGKLIATGGADNSIRLYSAADGVFVRALAGHAQALTALAFTADSTALASGDVQGNVRLWNVADGASLGAVSAHDASVLQIAFAPDGKQLLTASAGGTWKTWQLPLAPARAVTQTADAATKLALSADGKQLVIGSAGASVSIIDPTAVQPARPLAGQVGAATALATAGGLVATGSANGEIRLWNAADGADRLTLLGHDGAVSDVAVSSKGDAIISAGADGTLRLWKLPVAPKLLAGGELAVDVAVASQDASLVAVAGVAGGAPTIVVRNASTGAVVATLLGHEGAVTALAFSVDKTKLISGSADKTARVWNLADPKFPEISKFAGHAGAVTAVALSADGAQAFSAAADNSLKQWNTADAVEVRVLAGHTMAPAALAVAGPLLYSASADMSVRVWQVADGAAAGNFPAGGAVTGLAASADGKVLGVALADKTVRVLSAADGKLTATLTGLSEVAASLALGADGQRIAASVADGVRVWNIAGVALERFASAVPVKQVAFSPDGAALVAVDAKNVLQIVTPSLAQILPGKVAYSAITLTSDGARVFAGAADGSLLHYSAADFKLISTLAPGATAVSDVALSADGKLLAAAYSDKSIQLWDLATPATAQPAPATKTLVHTQAIASVCFAGTRLAAAAADNSVHVWDVASGQVLQRLPAHAAPASAVIASPDGVTIYSAGADKNVVANSIAGLRVVAAADAKIGIADAAVSADAKLLATASGAAVKLWDAATGAMTFELPLGQTPALAVVVRKDASQIAAADDTQLYLWGLTAAGPGAAAKVPVGAAVKRLAYEVAGTRIAAACADGHLRVFAAADGRLLEDVPQAAPSAVVAFTVDGQALVGTGPAEAAYVLPLALVRLITGHEGPVTGAAFTPDGTRLVTSGMDKTARLWNTADGAPLATFAGAADALVRLSLSKTGTLLCAAGADKNVLGWDVPAAGAAQPIAAKFTVPHAAIVHDVSLSGEGARLASSDAEGVVRVFDVASGRELERFHGHAGASAAVSLSDDGKTVVSGGVDKSTRVWPVSAKLVFVADAAKLVDAALTPDGAQFITAGTTDNAVKLWDATGKLVRPMAAAQAALARVAVRGDGLQIAGCDAQGRLLLWNVADGVLGGTAETGGVIGELSYSADGKKLAVAGAASLRVYDPAAATLLQENASTTPVLAVRFSPSGREMITGAEKLASVWAYASPAATANLAGHQGPVYSVAISADGKLAASASADQSIRLWNAATGEPAKQFSGHAGAVYSVHFTSDSTKLVSAGADGTGRLWDVAAGTELKKFAVEVAEGERIPAAYDVALAPNGATILMAGADAQLRLWNVANGQAAAPIKGHTDAIYRGAFNTAGNRILTCGHAGSLNVWDAASGQQLFTTKLAAAAYYAAHSPDGKRVVAACADGKAYIVDLPEAAQ
jgi:WD40 repeat protein